MALVYSFCFWFSLRLGGIIIASFSIAFIFLVLFIMAYGQIREIKEEVTYWINNLNLIYTKEHFEKFVLDPESFITTSVIATCFYIIVCILYIYGAYTFTNTLMYPYIAVEFIRLVMITLGIITWLLVLKRNTMDIGLLIGASVGCGFLLLGMCYLLVCAMNLPVLINEMKFDEQTATIAKLQNLLKESSNMQDAALINDAFPRRELNTVSRGISHRYF